MKSIQYSTLKRHLIRYLIVAVSVISLAVQQFTVAPAIAATTLPVLWSAGGLSAGNNSVGNSSSIASDSAGNIAIVSGPAFARSLGVTSYTKDGVLRWQQSVSPAAGTFLGNRIAAAPNGDFVAVGTNIDSSGHTIGATIVRYASDGTLQWRVDSPGFILSVGRLIVDSAGNAYLSFNSDLHKYSPSGTLLWTTYTSVPDSSAALSPDGSDIVVTGASGGIWRTAAITTSTGTTRWLVNAPEGVSTNDVVVDAGNVYVTGQGYTGASTPALTYYLTVVAYDRATGARLWRTDTNAPTGAASGNRMAQAPDGSLVVAGRTSAGGYFDWFIVALNNTGSIKWQTLRNQALSGDEVPASVFVRADGTTVVSGIGGPVTRDILGNSYMQGVTVGYDTTGAPQWEAFAKLPITWATPLPNGDICATGGYDALVTCWRIPAPVSYTPVLTATPVSGSAPLTVNFNRSVITDPNGPIISHIAFDCGDPNFGGGACGALDIGDGSSTFTLNQSLSHIYLLSGTYTATLTVAYTNGTSTSKTATITVAPIILPAQPPLITASPSSGTAPLNVTLTSSATMDPNGPMISSYQLNFGDGSPTLNTVSTSSFPSFSRTLNHIYTAAGTYTATLTVFYSNATSASSSTTITVTPVITQPPAITATPSSGTAPLAVTFTSSASSSNLLIGSYVVDYGDGTSNQFLINMGNGRPSFSATSSHTYATPGVYTAVLTVSYNNATTATASTTITVNPVVVTPALRSSAVTLSATLQRSRVSATGNVAVKDGNGAAIAGATVSATWTRPGGGTVTQTATTGSTGTARFSTSGNRGTYTLKVNNITKTGFTFDSANSITSGSITR